MAKKTDASTYLVDDQIHYVDPGEIHGADDNPRVDLKLADPARFAALKDSLQRGDFKPVLVEKSTMEIIGGHQRREAYAELGRKVPVLYLRDLTADEKKRIRIADNGAFGFWLLPELRLQMESLPAIDIPLIGLDASILDAINPPAEQESQTAPDEKMKTFSVKMTASQYDRSVEITERFCAKHKKKPGGAVSLMREEYAQGDPDIYSAPMPRKPRPQSGVQVVQKVQEAPVLPTPERSPHEPQRAIEKQLARRRVIYDCLLLGVKDNAGILHALAQKGCGVSEKTMIKDREAVRAEIRAAYKQESRELTEDIVLAPPTPSTPAT